MKCYRSSITGLSRVYRGFIAGVSRVYRGSIAGLSRVYRGSIYNGFIAGSKIEVTAIREIPRKPARLASRDSHYQSVFRV